MRLGIIAACFAIGLTGAAVAQQNQPDTIKVQPLPPAASATIKVCDVLFFSFPKTVPLKTFNPALADLLNRPNDTVHFVEDIFLAGLCGADILLGVKFTRSVVKNRAGQWIPMFPLILMQSDNAFAFVLLGHDVSETGDEQYTLRVAALKVQ
jgi:hypothetical protein